jgi:ABC-2 type transport system permease protein
MSGSVRRVRALMVKESLQILRDPSSILIAFVLPGLLLFIFGYGVSLDATEVPIGLVLEDSTPEIRSFAAAFTDSPYFDARLGVDRRAFDEALLAGELQGVVVVPSYFSSRFVGPAREAPIQLITDGAQPNTASFVEGYVRGTWQLWQTQQARAEGQSVRRVASLEPRYWFNPELNSHFFLVPGSVAIIMTLIGTLLTALVVAREWERGTMEALMATPVGITELLIGKLVPYYLLAMGSALSSVALATSLFGVPYRGSVCALMLVVTAFLAAALAMGLMISTLARNQFVAGQTAMLAAFLPAFLLSGFIFEISSMPLPIRLLTYVLPARYLVASLQTLFLAGDIWSVLLPAMGAMLVIAAVFFGITARFTAKRLD